MWEAPELVAAAADETAPEVLEVPPPCVMLN